MQYNHNRPSAVERFHASRFTGAISAADTNLAALIRIRSCLSLGFLISHFRTKIDLVKTHACPCRFECCIWGRPRVIISVPGFRPPALLLSLLLDNDMCIIRACSAHCLLLSRPANQVVFHPVTLGTFAM